MSGENADRLTLGRAEKSLDTVEHDVGAHRGPDDLGLEAKIVHRLPIGQHTHAMGVPGWVRPVLGQW